MKKERQIFISASESDSGDPDIAKRKLTNLNYETDGKYNDTNRRNIKI